MPQEIIFQPLLQRQVMEFAHLVPLVIIVLEEPPPLKKQRALQDGSVQLMLKQKQYVQQGATVWQDKQLLRGAPQANILLLQERSLLLHANCAALGTTLEQLNQPPVHSALPEKVGQALDSVSVQTVMQQHTKYTRTCLRKQHANHAPRQVVLQGPTPKTARIHWIRNAFHAPESQIASL